MTQGSIDKAKKHLNRLKFGEKLISNSEYNLLMNIVTECAKNAKLVEAINWAPELGIPMINECEQGNCATHFPQFTELTKSMLFNCLRRTLKEPKDSYFHRTYKNSKELVEVYKKALKLPFLEACALIYKTPESYVRYDMYLSLIRGRIFVHNQCCR